MASFASTKSFTSTQSLTIIPTHEIHSQLSTINVATQAPLKLTPTNYSAWRMQLNTLLIGYDLLNFVDGTCPCHLETLATTISNTTNLNFSLWIQQD